MVRWPRGNPRGALLTVVVAIDRVFAIGHFAICMTVIAFTYGIWQNWFQAAIVLSTLALTLIATSGAAKSSTLVPADDGSLST